MFEPKNILVPIDFSMASEKALHEAVDVAQEYHASLTLLHVIEPATNIYEEQFNAPLYEDTRLDSEKIEQSWERLHNEASKIPGSRSIEIHYDIRQGLSADEILHEQEEKDFDLIVMADHARSKSSKMMLGHVSGTVLSKSKIPVLLIRA